MIALITGATSGIGKSTAIEFAKHGYDLIITGRRKERLEELKASLVKEYSVKIFLTEKEIVLHSFITGSVFCDGKSILKVAVKNGYINIKTLQLAGKKKMDTPEVLRGFQINDKWKFIV